MQVTERGEGVNAQQGNGSITQDRDDPSSTMNSMAGRRAWRRATFCCSFAVLSGRTSHVLRGW